MHSTLAPASSVLFYDPVCQKPYDTDTVHRAAAGGTEASVTRIADALGALVMQHNRTQANGRYLPPQKIAGVTHVIVNRDSRGLRRVRELFPEARVHLWVHHHFPLGSKLFLRFASTVSFLKEMAVTIVCVSNQQRHELDALLRLLDLQERVTSCTIYNPVDDQLAPDSTAIDDGKLAFFSSPNKGLKFTLDAFRELRRRMPDLRLVVGNPGYKVREYPPIEGVEYLGPLPQSQIHVQVRSALCLFFPNFVYPETFGLVLAESKALGTPCLTSDCGAAAEILADPRQVLPVAPAEILYEDLFNKLNAGWRRVPARLAARAGLFDRYVERIRAWRAGERPVVGPDPRFKLSTVAGQWRGLLSRE
ncbi:MAG TPA: glycosyltransferase [Steroidobacteraceae bacterium]|nr:glycosyltransferase [Steroidobacteraceae bacterium]